MAPPGDMLAGIKLMAARFRGASGFRDLDVTWTVIWSASYICLEKEALVYSSHPQPRNLHGNMPPMMVLVVAMIRENQQLVTNEPVEFEK